LQVYLEASQRLRLAALARAGGQPAAVLIREAVERYIEQERCDVSADDPLLSLIGAAGGLENASDVAANHHRYLARGHASVSPAGAERPPRRKGRRHRKTRGRKW
jgi:hypothetical protein